MPAPQPLPAPRPSGTGSLPDCEAIRPLLEAYALGALEADEQALVERHLATCASCRALAADYAAVVHLLPQALAEASPHRLPPALRARLLARLEAGPDPAPAAAPPGRTWWRRPAWRPRRVAGLAAVAAVTLIAAASLFRSAELGIALDRERALRAEYASLVDQQAIVLDVVDSRQTVKRQLQPPDGAPGQASPPYGKLYTRPDLPQVVAMAARLPQPPPGQAYHLWVTRQGQTRLAGVLNTNAEGFGLLVFTAEENGPVYDAALITVQPAAGPSGTPPATPSEAVVLRWQA